MPALDTPAVQRTAKQNELAAQAEEAIKVGHDEVARRMPGGPERRDAAKKLAKEAWSTNSSPPTPTVTAAP